MKQKMWRCKICSSTQNYSSQDVICKNCGTDLSMGPGEIVFEGDTPASYEASPGKKKMLPILAVIGGLLAVAAVVVLLVQPWGKEPGPATLQEPTGSTTTAPTTPPTTQPTTEPTTEAPTTEPTTTATEPTTTAPTEPATQSPTVNRVELNVYDLLLDSSGKKVSWAPVEHSMGYEGYIIYNGTAGNESMTLTSDNPSVLAVDGSQAKLTAKAPGTATLTAQAGGKSETYPISVYPVDRSSGSRMDLTEKKIVVDDQGQKRLIVTAEMHFAGDVTVAMVDYLAKEHIRLDKLGQWTKVSDRVYSRTFEFIIEPEAKIDQGISLMFYMVREDANGGTDPATNLLDWRVLVLG